MASRVAVDDERLKGRRCGIDNCPSKRYFRVDGRIVCDRGHEQNFLETADDEDAPVSTAVKRHKFSEGGAEAEERKRKRREELKPISREANSLLYLQCYQFILHAQVKSLLHLGLPTELEGIVMELWGIYITALDVKIHGKNKAKSTTATEDDDAEYTRTISDSSNEELSDDEDDSSTSNMPSEGRAYRSSTQELKKYPPLLISVLFSYFGILILKLPVTLSDIFAWIKAEHIPYFRANNVIPLQMLRRLHPRTQARFTVYTKLEPMLLHSTARSLAVFYLQEFNIKMPSLNYPPILWKYITAMSFPLETFSIATRIANTLELKKIGFTPEMRGEKKGGYPDAKLMALLVVACKLGFNLEKTPAWKDWANGSEEEEARDKDLENDDVGENDILMMSDEKLDDYMDWIQSKWIDNNLEPTGKKRIPDGILSMFPLNPQATTVAPDVPPPPSDGYLLLQPKNGRHAENYRIYRTSAIPPPVLRRMTQRGASVIGVEEETLRYSIRWIESNLNKWKVGSAGHQI